MGVYRLKSFVQKRQQLHEVNVQTLAKTYHRQTGRQPVILIDGNCSLYHLYNGSSELLGGGLRQFVSNMQEFVMAIKNAGLKPVFFFDGQATPVKLNCWRSRQVEKVRKVKQTLNNLSRWQEQQTNQTTTLQLLPPMVGAVGRFVVQQLCDCEVHVSVQECDEEMANYARTHNVFGILANDTDFYIFEGPKYVFSMDRFNVETMQTVCYCREDFIKHIGIHADHMPLLASMMGTDIIPSEELHSFYTKIGFRIPSNGYINCIYLVPNLIAFLKRLPSGRRLTENLFQIALDMFDGDNTKTQLFLQSVQSYSSQNRSNEFKRDQEQLCFVLDKHVSARIPPHIYSVMVSQIFQLGRSMELYDSGLKPAADIFQPIRRREYGILLHSYPTHLRRIEEWCVTGENFQRQNVRAEPADGHPGLKTLWKLDDTSEDKWRLFTRGVSDSLPAKKLKRLPSRLVVPTAALFYLVKFEPGLLHPKEVEAFMLQAVLLQSVSLETLQSLDVPLPTPKLIHDCTVFGVGITSVLSVLAACGYDLAKFMPWLYYDGALFHKIYLDIQQGATSERVLMNRKNLLEEFSLVKDIVYT